MQRFACLRLHQAYKVCIQFIYIQWSLWRWIEARSNFAHMIHRPKQSTPTCLISYFQTVLSPVTLLFLVCSLKYALICITIYCLHGEHLQNIRHDKDLLLWLGYNSINVLLFACMESTSQSPEFFTLTFSSSLPVHPLCKVCILHWHSSDIIFQSYVVLNEINSELITFVNVNHVKLCWHRLEVPTGWGKIVDL